MKFHVKEPILGISNDGIPMIQISKVDGEVWLDPSLRNESEAAKLFWAAVSEAAFDIELEAEIGAAKAIKRAKVDRSDDRLMEMPWKKIQKTTEQLLAEHIEASAERHLREMRDSWRRRKLGIGYIAQEIEPVHYVLEMGMFQKEYGEL